MSEDEFAAAVREELERDAARQPRVVPLAARRPAVAWPSASCRVLLPAPQPLLAPETDIELDWRVPELAPVAEPARPAVEGIAVGTPATQPVAAAGVRPAPCIWTVAPEVG